MKATADTNEMLRVENAQLRARLDEAEAMLRAIRAGEVDALVVDTAAGRNRFTLQGVDAQNSRMRGEMLEQVSDAVIAVDAEERVTFLNAAAERQYGVTAVEILGCRLGELYEVRWLQPGDEAVARAALRECGKWRGEIIHVTHEGRELYVESSVSMLRGPDDATTSMVAAHRDITERKLVDVAHRVSEERLKLAAEAGRAGIWDWNLVTDTLVWDDAMFALYGSRREDFSGAHAAWASLLHPEDKASSEAAAQEAVAGRKDYPIEYRVIWPDGSVHHIEAHGRVFRDEAGQPLRMVGTNVDITARKLRERNLVFLADMQKVFAPLTTSAEIMRAVGERLAEHLGLMHCALVEVDEAADACTVLYDHHAPGTQNLAGDYRLSDFHPEEERRVLASGAPLVIADVRDDGRTAARAEHFEALGVRALVDAVYLSGGRWRFVLHASRAEPYAWPAEEVELLTELAARVYVRVERARAETSLRDSEEFNRTVLESSPDCLKVIAADGTVLSLNENGCSLLRLADPTVLVGKKWWSFWPEESRALVQNAALRASQGETVRFEREAPIGTGEMKWWDVEVSPVRNPDGSVSRIVAVSRDITERKRAEVALARLAAIVESSHDALFGEDLDGIITSWNRGAEKIFGYRAEEIVGTSIMRLMPSDRQTAEHELQRQIVAGELGGTFEAIRLTKEGREFPASITIAPLKDAAGKVIGTSRVLRDITETKRAEEALRENAALFSTLIAQAPMGTYVVDAQFRMRQINAEAMPSFGSVQPLIGRDFQEVVEFLWGPEVGGPIVRVFRHTLATGERYVSPPFTQTRHDISIEQSYEWQTQRVTLPDGQYGVVCYFHEVTERAQATAALRASEERMRLAAEATGVGIWEWNVLTDAIRWDASMFRIYGIEPTPDGLVHYDDWSGAVVPEDLVDNETILQDIVRRCGQSTREFRIRRRSDGECRWIHAVETTRANHEGKAEWVLGTNLDVTERVVSAGALRDANRLKDEFLATLAHELRNPLAPVRMASEFLRLKGPAIPQLQWAVDVIDRQTQAMSRLIDDLMDVSRINQGKIELRREHVALGEIVHGAVETSHPLINELGHELTVTLPPRPVIVDADVTRLAQVFLNLLNNAAKYTDRGGQIALRAELQGRDVVVSVTDTGIGIPADKLPTLFEMFSQVEGALSRSRGGLGIGLCLVKRLVEMHGGSIEAKSGGLGKGSEFVVRLPIVVEQTAPRPASHDDGGVKSISSLRILVVDDNRDAAESLAMLLTALGNSVHTAHDGEEAVAAAGTFRPDVVLCDIGLPKLNGYEACRRMKAQAWDEKMILIALTGWGQDDDRRKSEEAGFDHHMVKPVEPQALMKVLAAIGSVKARSDLLS